MPRRKKSGKIRWTSVEPKPKRSLLGRVAAWCVILLIWGTLGVASVVGWYAYNLPDVTMIGSGRQPNITILAADGTQLAAVGDIHGETVVLREVSPNLTKALIAIEDRRFYEHSGIDPRGLARAMLANLKAGRIVQGGSTITQQLAKNLFLTPERTIRRKVQEVLLALWMERHFTKDEILTLYLNRVYFGGGNYGVDAAARRYFDKTPADLTVYEAALLAGLLKAPSRYNPATNAAGADRRTALVLSSMVEAGFLTAAESEAALENKTAARGVARGQARYFTDWVLSQVQDYVGPTGRDLVILTTLNAELQAVAEAETTGLLDGPGKELDASQAAFVALDTSGAVRAMVGGRDYRSSQFNRSVQALRQPGSAFKPFIYLSAFESGRTPDDRFVDEPVTLDDWTPRNYDDRYLGEVTLREAFARSLNSVAVRVALETSPEAVAAMARRLGITSPISATPSIALGTSEVSLLELTGAYAAFANGGVGVWPYGIAEIRDSSGRTLYRRSGDGPGQLIAGEDVDQMTDVMTATVEWGTGKAANPGRPAAGKTGTSQDFRDAWFIGYTADLVGGAWFGNDDGTPMRRVTGGGLPARLWARIMTRGLAGVPSKPLPRAGPEGGEGLISRILRGLGGDGAASDTAANTRFGREDGGPQR